MENKVIDEFLKQHDLTRYQVAKISGVAASTLQTATDNDLNKMQVKILQALAMATGLTAGQVLDELIKLEGNPIIQFIRQHPYLDKKLVQEVENKLIEAHEKHINLKTITFNRYYNEAEDTKENAEQALRNLLETLEDIFKKIGK